MRKYTSRLFYILALAIIITAFIMIIQPFNIVDLEQAQRIAKWRSEYMKLNYSFDLVKLHENTIIPDSKEAGVIITDEYIINRIKPYFNLEYSLPMEVMKYSYKKMNGRIVNRQNQFYFDKFVRTKTGQLISVKKNESIINDDELPLFYMFIDINGEKNPNKIGKDIFFINIFKDKITPLGEGKAFKKLKISCSPIGNGLYCSKLYFLSGHI